MLRSTEHPAHSLVSFRPSRFSAPFEKGPNRRQYAIVKDQPIRTASYKRDATFKPMDLRSIRSHSRLLSQARLSPESLHPLSHEMQHGRKNFRPQLNRP